MRVNGWLLAITCGSTRCQAQLGMLPACRGSVCSVLGLGLRLKCPEPACRSSFAAAELTSGNVASSDATNQYLCKQWSRHQKCNLVDILRGPRGKT